MNDLLAQLLALTGSLEETEAVSAELLDEVRRLVAACLIQQNPALLPVIADPHHAQALNEAAVAGASLAAERSAAGVRLRFIREPYLAPVADSSQPFMVAGPFIDGDAGLVQFRFFESIAMRAVSLEVDIFFVQVHELLMLLPRDTAADAELSVFSIPAGTVWLRAERLVPGAGGYVALRVSGGSLQFDRPATIAEPGGNVQIALGVNWTLTLEPEPAPQATFEGSDANALSLQLPSRLELRSDGTVSVAGAIGIAGYGSTISFETPSGEPVAADQAIVFPYDAGLTTWSVAGNRSPLANFEGECTVQAALWVVPLTLTPPEEACEAAHGGLVALRLQGRLQSSLSGAQGHIGWLDVRLVANAQGIELAGRHADASARINLALWGSARSDLDFGAGISGLRFASRRDGADMLALVGGRLRNRWDLPQDASGQPFPCDATIETFSTIAEADGLRRIAVTASQLEPTRLHGLVLENLYLSVSTIRKMAFAGSGPAPGELSAGKAQLVFDVQLGEPMLPDPYAANWSRPDQFQMIEAALSVALRWQPDAAPAVHTQLERTIPFPEPRYITEESDLRLREMFHQHLQSQPEFLSLLDLSTRDHHFGVALESLSDQQPQIDAANRLSVELRHVRLLMQPQVHWEPVQVIANPDVGTIAETVQSMTHGGRSLTGANTVKLVPVLPGAIGQEIVAVANGQENVATLFSLPFGLRAYVHMDPIRGNPFLIPPIAVQLHEPRFEAGLVSAQQLRLLATGGRRPNRPLDPARGMPGAMHQTKNLEVGAGPKRSLLQPEIADMLNFDTFVPLHAADLSGYGLSCFSRWQREPISAKPEDDVFGVTKVHLDVLIGRTAYEVIEVRSVLALCQCRVVRTIVFERRNSGRVQCFDSGWQAIDDGLFNHYVPFETGVLRALRNIRHIRILSQPRIRLDDPLDPSVFSLWQPVIFDADAQIDDVVAGGKDGLVPALDHQGYIQIQPVWRGDKAPPAGLHEAPNVKRFAALCKAVGGPIGGAIDCRTRLGGTLEMHLSALLADLAPDDGGAPGFAVAAYGSPTLPRAGQWSAVRIDGATSDISPVDPHHGIPVIQRPGQAYTFRDPADARRNHPSADYGLLMSTPTSRVLFPRPRVDPGQAGRLTSAPPMMADPTCLLQGSSSFPRAAFVLGAKESPQFDISDANQWRLSNPDFSFEPPLPGVASGAGWDLQRSFVPDAFGLVPPFHLDIDSAVPALPWQMTQPPDKFELNIEPFGVLFSIDSSFKALAGAAAGLLKPSLTFGKRLVDLQEIVNSLKAMGDLPAGLDVNVDVAVGEVASPSFIVRMNLKFSIGGGPDGRVDIGLGKFFGEFELDGEFQAALNGATHGRLSLVFQGDVQQAIIPPLLYAGGMFRFAMEVRDGDTPLIELGLGTATSIGGDLIKGLLAVEATVKYGYMLIPESLKPGVMLGIDARAKLLGGLLALSFSANALARIERLNDDKTVTIFADLRVAGSVQVAVFFEEDVDFRTQFEQRIPLAPLLIVAGANPLLAAATLVAL